MELIDRREGRQQSGRIQDKDHFGRNMDKCRKQRVENAERCQANTDGVYNQRSDEVLHDDPVTASRRLQGLDKL